MKFTFSNAYVFLMDKCRRMYTCIMDILSRPSRDR